MSEQATVITVNIQDELLREIERLRKKAMRKTGHISRSGLIRWLLREGLSVVGTTKAPERSIHAN